MDVPQFADLPKLPGGPSRGCAWDVWNAVHAQLSADEVTAVGKDELGTLNHLTPAVVAAAGKEIQTGDRVALKWVTLRGATA